MKIKQHTIVKPLPSAELIKKHETSWKLELPSTYLDFIKMYHGVGVKEATFVCENRSYVIERFLCILEDIEDSPKGIYDIDVVISQIEERLTDNEDLLGAEVLPIASLFAGDFVCLDFRENKENPPVCIWSHEESGEFEPVFYKIADNFTEFLEVLQ